MDIPERASRINCNGEENVESNRERRKQMLRQEELQERKGKGRIHIKPAFCTYEGRDHEWTERHRAALDLWLGGLASLMDLYDSFQHLGYPQNSRQRYLLAGRDLQGPCCPNDFKSTNNTLSAVFLIIVGQGNLRCTSVKTHICMYSIHKC